MNNRRERWLWFAVCTAGAALLLLFGWLVPIHLRAVDLAVIQRAGGSSPSVVAHGMALANEGQFSAAKLFSQVAQSEHLPGAEQLSLAVAQPRATVSSPTRIEQLLPDGYSQPITASVIRLKNRDRVLEFLQAAPLPEVRELLRGRDLTNTVLFPPSSSASGQAFDAALSVCGLLLEENCLTPGLRQAVQDRVAVANRGGDPEPLEEVLMDIMSLGQRLNWEQLTVFVRHIDAPRTLDRLATQARNVGPQMPLLFAAVDLSQKPAAVAAYLDSFTQSGLADLGTSLRSGSGALDQLLQRNQRIHTSNLRQRLAASGPFGFFYHAGTDYALHVPWIALTVKWFLYLSGGFLIAAALHVARSVPGLEEPLRVRGFHVFREILFALGFLLVVLLLSEPFLAQDSQKVEFPLRLRLPSVGSVAAVATPNAKTKLMNAPSLLTLLLFFVLQGLIYIACLVKLAEIRRQKVVPRIRLRLLENEEHLFDAGLYLGFCGTIVSLILVSLGVIQPSLMAAYSSTSFGIIFVSVFKIFQLRPARRQLLLESEAEAAAAERVAPAPPAYATTT